MNEYKNMKIRLRFKKY